MSDFNTASSEDVARLLYLFPLAALKEQWEQFSGTKDQIASQVAGSTDRATIAEFALQNFGRCRQHITVLDGTGKPNALASAFPDAELVAHSSSNGSLYLASSKYVLHLTDPYEQQALALIWPIRVIKMEGAIVVSTVTFERNPAQYADRAVLKVDRAVDEKDIATRMAETGFAPVDLHKGVKRLWHSGFMDASRVIFKRPKSTSSENMDEEVGIRENDPELYATLRKSQLFNTFFLIDGKAKTGIEHLFINPTTGRIILSKYTDADGDVDHVVRAILKQNS